MFQVTELQLAVLRELWTQGEASVADVHGALQNERGLATTTVATLLSRLQKRGLVTHRTDGRKHVYRSTVSESEVQSALLDSVTDGVFGGDVTALVSHLLSKREVSTGDLAAVQQILDRMQDQVMDEATDTETHDV